MYLLCCDRVHLINKNDRGRILLCKFEDISHHPRSLPKIFLHKLRTHNSDECCSCVVSNSLSHHSFTCSRRSIHQYTLGRINTYLIIKLRISQRKLYCFSHFLFLSVQATDIWETNIRFFLYLHHLNCCVWLWGENVNYWVTVTMHCDTSGGL